MAWQDRIREAAYTSPSGERLAFLFEDVRTEVTKRTTAFVFPGVDEAYVQDNGHGARRFPLRCYFAGDDHDLEANAFVAALLERGIGRLEHPFYGAANVVPLGQITRRDDLREAAGQTVLDVVFSTSLAAVYPQLAAEPRTAVEQQAEAFETAAAAQFEEAADLSTVAAQEETKAKTRDALQELEAALAEVSDATAKVSATFQDALDSINSSLDVLISQPLSLAQQLVSLVTAPARAASTLAERLDGYAGIVDNLTTASDAIPSLSLSGGVVIESRRRNVANAFHLTNVLASAAVSGAVISTLETEFTSRPAALEAAQRLLDELDALVVYLDDGYATLASVEAPGGIDTGTSYQALQQLVVSAAARLVEISFSLLPERSIVLDRPRTILDLAAELYGSVADERLDFLIDTNGFTGSEILEVPRGRRVVFYA